MSSITSINGTDFYYCPLAKIAFQVTSVTTVKMVEAKKYLDEEETTPVEILQIKLKDGEVIYLADSNNCEIRVRDNYYAVAYCTPDLFATIAYTFKFEYRKFGNEN